MENCVLKLSTNNLLALIYITAEYLALECTGVLSTRGGGGCWQGGPKSLLKVTVQFETEGNGQNEIVSYMDRSEVKL